MPDQNKQSLPQFLRKLGYYLMGIAIGFVALGFFQRMRQSESAKRAEADKAAAEALSPLFPPPPTATSTAEPPVPASNPPPNPNP